MHDFKEEMHDFKEEMHVFKGEMHVFKEEMHVFKLGMHEKISECTPRMAFARNLLLMHFYLFEVLGHNVLRAVFCLTPRKRAKD